MEDNAITAQTITQVAQMEPETIASLSEQVIDATKIGNKTIDELEHLSQCLADFSETQEKYNKTTKQVKNQMRYISNHL